MLIATFLLMTLASCNVTPTSIPSPTPVPTPMPVTVRQLIDGSEKYAGHKVTMTGTVIIECTEGCWFFLNDDTGIIYIDLATAGLHIPQKIGSRVTLLGEISGSGGNLRILAEAVSFPE